MGRSTVATERELTATELEALYFIERLLRILNQRTRDDEYGELADLLALKCYGPRLVRKGEKE